jgi:hypothetical protein
MEKNKKRIKGKIYIRKGKIEKNMYNMKRQSANTKKKS